MTGRPTVRVGKESPYGLEECASVQTNGDDAYCVPTLHTTPPARTMPKLDTVRKYERRLPWKA